MKPDKQYFPQLTGVRVLAAYMVYAFHCTPFNKPTTHLTNFFVIYLKGFINDLNVGVTVFFVLSGFLICYRYGDYFLQKQGTFYNYVVNRVARIYPMFFLLTALTFIVTRSNFSESPLTVFGYFLMNITFLKGFFNGVNFSGINQAWTLTVEECFYFLAPVIFFSMRRVKLIFHPIILTLTGIVIVRFLGTHIFMPDIKYMMNFTFFGRCFDFYVGIYVALLYKKYKATEISKRSFHTYGGALIMFFSISCMAIIPGHYFTYISALAINSYLLTIGIGFFFWGLLTEASHVRRLFSTPLFQLLGKSSYIFYLIHVGVIHDFLTHHLPPDNLYIALLKFVLLNIISIGLFLLVENPLNALIKKMLLKKKEKVVVQYS